MEGCETSSQYVNVSCWREQCDAGQFARHSGFRRRCGRSLTGPRRQPKVSRQMGRPLVARFGWVGRPSPNPRIPLSWGGFLLAAVMAPLAPLSPGLLYYGTIRSTGSNNGHGSETGTGSEPSSD